MREDWRGTNCRRRRNQSHVHRVENEGGMKRLVTASPHLTLGLSHCLDATPCQLRSRSAHPHCLPIFSLDADFALQRRRGRPKCSLLRSLDFSRSSHSEYGKHRYKRSCLHWHGLCCFVSGYIPDRNDPPGQRIQPQWGHVL